MPYEYKPDTETPIYDLASKMDDRQNNESIALDPNSTGFTFVSLTNGDLFNTKSLSNRLGTKDVCVGLIGSTYSGICIFDTQDNLPSGTSDSFKDYKLEGLVYDKPGTIIIPTSGNNNVYEGNTYIRNSPAPSGITDSMMVDVRMYLYEMNQLPFPASGIGSMIKSSAPFGQHDIQLSGNYNVPPYPEYFPITLSTSANDLPPIASTNIPALVEIGMPINISGTLVTPWTNVPWKFEAPHRLDPNKVYFLQAVVSSGTQNISSNAFDIEVVTNPSTDIIVNTIAAEKFLYSGFGPYPIQFTSLREFGPDKTWIKGCIDEYVSPSWILEEIPTADFAFGYPVASGNFISQNNYPSKVFQVLTPSTPPPIITSNPSVSIGQVISIPSGTYQIFGDYFYANTYSGMGTWGQLTNHTSAGGSFDPANYSVNYTAKLHKINTAGGLFYSGTYLTNDTTELASYSGNYTFTQPMDKWYVTTQSPNYELKKIYALFDNPITITSTGATNDYLLTWEFINPSTGKIIDDWTLMGPSAGSPNFYSFGTPFVIGLQANPSGQYVSNYNGDGKTYTGWDAGTSLSHTHYDLTHGLIFTPPSGNSLNGLYDYRIGENRVQRVILGQGGKLLEAPIYSCNWNTIYSSGSSNQNDKWSFSTYQNLLMGHQYSKISGVCWDQIYLNPSGDSTQGHGQRPTFHLSETSGINIGITGYSGSSIQVLLATQMASGGLRASEIQTITLSGNSNAMIQIQGGPSGTAFGTGTNSYNSILNPSGYQNHESQFAFDVLPQATYVFTTAPSGQIFYLAGLVPTTTSGIGINPIVNPLPNVNSFNNGGSGTFIADISATTLTQQIPNVVNYDQSYLTQQVDTPKFKKTIIFKDYVLGTGDPLNPSRIWFAEQFTCHIFGIDGQFTGYIDIDPNNGSPITGMDIFKDFLLVFKYNSCYRLTYTGDPSIPFATTQLSNTIGSLGFFGTVHTDYGVFGLSQFGPFLATYAGVDTVGDEIVPFFNSFDHTDLTFSVGLHDRLRQQIYWSISSKDISPELNTGIVYSYAEKAWGIRQGGMYNIAAVIGDENNFSLLYCGDTMGKLKQLSVGDSDQDILFNDGNGTSLTKAISLKAETPWLNLGNSQHLKQLKNIRINCAQSLQQMRIDVYMDQDEFTPKYSRILNMNSSVNNRVVSIAQTCRTVKFVLTTFGEPSRVRLNSIQFAFKDLGPRQNI